MQPLRSIENQQVTDPTPAPPLEGRGYEHSGCVQCQHIGLFPNVKGLPKWEPYNEQTGVTMVLDNKCEPRQHHDRELMQMSRSIW